MTALLSSEIFLDVLFRCTFCPQNKGAKLEQGERKMPAVFRVSVPTGTYF